MRKHLVHFVRLQGLAKEFYSGVSCHFSEDNVLSVADVEAAIVERLFSFLSECDIEVIKPQPCPYRFVDLFPTRSPLSPAGKSRANPKSVCT